MPYPVLSQLEQTEPAVRRILSAFSARLTGFLSMDLAEDGTHQQVRERGRTTPMGEWITPPYVATDYSGTGGMTWGVDLADVVTFAYMLIGKTMFVNGVWNTTSVTAPLGVTLTVKIPGGFTAAKTMRCANRATDNGVVTATNGGVDAGGTVMLIQRLDGAAWTASVNNSNIRLSAAFEVQ